MGDGNQSCYCKPFAKGTLLSTLSFISQFLIPLYQISSPSDSVQVYWLGPIIGAVLAGALYQYVYCPDDDLKHTFKETLSKTTQQSKGKYIEVEDPKSQRETDDLLQKPGMVHFIDLERGDDKKGRDSTNEVLSSV